MWAARRIVRRPLLPVGGLDGLHPLVVHVLAARRIVDPAALSLGLDGLVPHAGLSNIEAAAALLETALRAAQRILVVGDFDADGATSTAVAIRALRSMGAADVDFLVPNRFEDGYGLTPAIVAQALPRRPELLITVDNGIASVDGVAAARAAGIRVLVTDHHLPGAELPAADAIVNPCLAGDGFPSKALAGVGVIFYVMLALRARLRDGGWFAERGSDVPNLAELLDLVALGTVADVVPLDANNRILVAQGVKRIRAGRGCAGIAALARVAKRDPARLVAADLGFAIGPRLNAAGRMQDMALGIRCLVTDDPQEALRLAVQLDELNRERREVEESMRREAMAELERLAFDDAELPFGLCLYNGDWHEGVIGILASRVKDRTHRPVVCFTDAGDGRLRGSARSVAGFHIRDALEAIATREPALIDRFGGHAMAAGLTVRPERFAAFRAAFDTEVRRHLGAEDLHGVLHSDGELAPQDFTVATAEMLRTLLPWGQACPEPVFDGVFEVVDRRIVGGRHLRLGLRLPGSGLRLDAIAFGIDPEWGGSLTGRLHLAYRLDVNEWNGKRSLQLVVEHGALVGASAAVVPV